MDYDKEEMVKRVTITELNLAIRSINSTIDFTNGDSYDERARAAVRILEKLKEEVKNRA